MQPFLNSSRPVGSWATILALEPVTLTEPPTVSPQQEKTPPVSAPLTTSPASTPLAPQLPSVRSPQQSGPPLLRTQSDGPSQLSPPPPSSQFLLSVLRPMRNKSGQATRIPYFFQLLERPGIEMITFVKLMLAPYSSIFTTNIHCIWYIQHVICRKTPVLSIIGNISRNREIWNR